MSTEIQELMEKITELQLANIEMQKLRLSSPIDESHRGYGKAIFEIISWIKSKGWLLETEGGPSMVNIERRGNGEPPEYLSAVERKAKNYIVKHTDAGNVSLDDKSITYTEAEILKIVTYALESEILDFKQRHCLAIQPYLSLLRTLQWANYDAAWAEFNCPECGAGKNGGHHSAECKIRIALED